MVNNIDETNCYFLIGKVRVTPTTFVCISRLELTATVLLTKRVKFMKKDLQLECTHETCCTDRKAVLRYSQNNTKRFKTFVPNRIHQIQAADCNNGDMYHQKLIQLTMHHVVYE